MNFKEISGKLITIIQHEYMSKFKTKGFLFGTLFGPLAMLAVFGVAIAAAVLSKDQTERKLAIVDYTSNLAEELVASDTSKYYINNESIDSLNSQIIEGSLDGYILIPSTILDSGDVEVYSEGGGGLGFVSSLESNLGSILMHRRLQRAGVDTSVIELVGRRLDVKTKKVTEEGVEEDNAEGLAAVGYGLGFAIYMLMFIYGTWVSRGVIEEKANRIIEVIASSAKPFEILLGKVVGIGLLGLTQVMAWLVIGFILLQMAAPIIAMTVDIDPATLSTGMNMQDAQTAQAQEIMSNFPKISVWMIIGFVFYFLAGYFIYASLFAAVGSAVDQEQDAQQLLIPVTLPIIIPILLINVVMTNPDGMLSVLLSLFPFFTPIIMTVRIAASNVPVWQIGLSVVLVIGTFLGTLWVASRIYRVGILMTGKKPTFKDLYKWLRA